MWSLILDRMLLAFSNFSFQLFNYHWLCSISHKDISILYLSFALFTVLVGTSQPSVPRGGTRRLRLVEDDSYLSIFSMASLGFGLACFGITNHNMGSLRVPGNRSYRVPNPAHPVGALFSWFNRRGRYYLCAKNFRDASGHINHCTISIPFGVRADSRVSSARSVLAKLRTTCELPFFEYLRSKLGGSIHPYDGGSNYRWSVDALNEVIFIANLINGHMRTPKIAALDRLITFFHLNHPLLHVDNLKPLDTSPLDSNAWLSGMWDAAFLLLFLRMILERLGIVLKYQLKWN